MKQYSIILRNFEFLTLWKYYHKKKACKNWNFFRHLKNKNKSQICSTVPKFQIFITVHEIYILWNGNQKKNVPFWHDWIIRTVQFHSSTNMLGDDIFLLIQCQRNLYSIWIVFSWKLSLSKLELVSNERSKTFFFPWP